MGDNTGDNVQALVLAAVRDGDQAAFGELTDRYRHELRVHCYRMLGSRDDADDIVQETLLRAWRRRQTYQGRSTFRAWLYKIATNACLDLIDERGRVARPYRSAPLAGNPASPPTEVPWLQPAPEALFAAPDAPAETAIARETVELAFLVAVQRLPATQRAVLITRDVLGWPAADTAALLGTSVAAVKSALQRARATLREHLPPDRGAWRASAPTRDERALVRRYVDAHERADLDVLASLLADDVRLTMPPYPAWLRGRDAMLSFTREVFDPDSTWYHGQWRSVVTRANTQPAVAHYVERPTADETRSLPGTFRAQVLDVLTVESGRIRAVTSFEPRHFAAFGLPLVLS
ncbi:RNA polymerase subunit sigma-70 [Saccharomonospora cyanea]|uniref:RNA polymerase sigma factor n=1 Tax=Saccharomonospora cyanea NA-134 TaxID=882082 RepID=H5XF45_9PSEU|nr:RNA polymerase subunit sigma-70 [Saccharomonospora cyanea]EHR61455.1 RNA polymerase sigma-70 factor, TIGR02960 family [Saccharomonospora cyanea NA-134]